MEGEGAAANKAGETGVTEDFQDGLVPEDESAQHACTLLHSDELPLFVIRYLRQPQPFQMDSQARAMIVAAIAELRNYKSDLELQNMIARKCLEASHKCDLIDANYLAKSISPARLQEKLDSTMKDLLNDLRASHISSDDLESIESRWRKIGDEFKKPSTTFDR